MDYTVSSLQCFFLVLCLSLLVCSNSETSYKSNKKPILINFGDSNSDTGGVLAGVGLPIGLPHGITFFHRGTGRLGDGRLIVDFYCESQFFLFFFNKSFNSLNICFMYM